MTPLILLFDNYRSVKLMEWDNDREAPFDEFSDDEIEHYRDDWSGSEYDESEEEEDEEKPQPPEISPIFYVKQGKMQLAIDWVVRFGGKTMEEIEIFCDYLSIARGTFVRCPHLTRLWAKNLDKVDLTELRSLRELRLGRFIPDQRDLDDLFKIGKLKRLSLNNGDISLKEVALHCRSLKSLELCHIANLKKEELISISQNCKQLTDFRAHKCEGMEDYNQFIVKHFPNNTFVSFRHPTGEDGETFLPIALSQKITR